MFLQEHLTEKMQKMVFSWFSAAQGHGEARYKDETAGRIQAQQEKLTGGRSLRLFAGRKYAMMAVSYRGKPEGSFCGKMGVICAVLSL